LLSHGQSKRGSELLSLDSFGYRRYSHQVYPLSGLFGLPGRIEDHPLNARGKSMKKMVVHGLTKSMCAVFIASLCVLGFSWQQQALAAGKDSFRVGVIDPQTVIEKSKAGSRALAALKEHAQARETVMKNDQKELEKLQEELKDGETKKLSEDEQKRKQERFTQKFQAWQKQGQDFQNELGQKQKDLVQEYMKKIEEATSAVASRHGFDVVIDKGSENTLKIVLFSRDGLDLTNEVVKEFDRRFK
jgi:outer membrane protein